MMTLLLILIPLLGGAAVWGVKKYASMLLAVCAFAHAVGTLLLLCFPKLEAVVPLSPAYLGQDMLSKIVLAVTSFLFLAVSVHTFEWLGEEKKAQREPQQLLPDHIFVSCLLAFLGTMTLVVSSRNFGLLWVAVEATTLVSAPLILFHRSAHSLEAMWKYLLICSVGIGLALFGTMLLAVSGQGAHVGLGFDALKSGALAPQWFRAAFIFILAGYGTKMGLAPFHTWLPDAHSEAPGTVSALLSGALLNCSFLGIVRVLGVAPAELLVFCKQLLTCLGVFSLATAAFFIIRQTDYKRMLAYSSVEHMGLIAIMWGCGAEQVALIHLCGHSLIKMTLFLTAGNLLLACGTRKISEVGGLLGRVPRNAALWLFLLLMICGIPPSPLFVTEFWLIGSVGTGLGITILLLLFAVFAGMTHAGLKMAMGQDGKNVPAPDRAASAETLWPVPFICAFLALAGGMILTMIWLGGR